MKQYKVKAEGLLTLQDGTTRPFTLSRNVNLEDNNKLKEWFKEAIGAVSEKNNAKASEGTVTVEYREWKPLVENRTFTGTFIKTETITIDI